MDESEKLARKIKRCLDKIPDKFIVIITSNNIQVCDKEEFYQYEKENGHIDNVPTLHCENFQANVVGCDCKL